LNQRPDPPVRGEAVWPGFQIWWRIPEMAKALLGHVGGPDPRLVTEVRRLRRRVHDLEAEVLRLQAENDSLTDALETSPVLGEVTEPEPALA